jgi:aspartokinase-like uncharacterized kinase
MESYSDYLHIFIDQLKQLLYKFIDNISQKDFRIENYITINEFEQYYSKFKYNTHNISGKYFSNILSNLDGKKLIKWFIDDYKEKKYKFET